jgi:hypothetical protein
MNDALAALKLHVAYEAVPADRGGKRGPKGKAWAAWIAARDAAIRDAMPVASVEEAEMAAFAASDAACVLFPGAGQQAERDAFRRGAEHATRAVSANQAGLLREAEFLLDRLDEFERDITDDDAATEFLGHVSPSKYRLRMILTRRNGGDA